MCEIKHIFASIPLPQFVVFSESLSWAYIREKRIGVIRQFFPKGTDLREISEERIKTIEQHLNFRPVRKFDYISLIQQTLKHRAASVALMG